MSTNPNQTSTCPTCGASLTRNGKAFTCKQHGDFFRYGANLLVRVPRPAVSLSVLPPWEPQGVPTT